MDYTGLWHPIKARRELGEQSWVSHGASCHWRLAETRYFLDRAVGPVRRSGPDPAGYDWGLLREVHCAPCSSQQGTWWTTWHFYPNGL